MSRPFRFAALAFCLIAVGAQAAPFTPGNVVVYRVGDGSAALSNAATAAFLDEYTPAGTLVQSIALPTVDAAPQQTLTQSGTATSAGLLTRSADGNFLLATGYDAAVGTAGITGSASATVNRIVARIGANGVVDTSTALGSAYNTDNIRAAASVDGSRFWISGAGAGGTGGIWTTTFGATTGEVQVSTTVTNTRQVDIYGGQLYVSTGSGNAIRIGTVGTGLPTTTGQTIANLPGFPTAGSPYAFFFADLSAGVAGLDTLYVADDSASGLAKFSLVAGSWVANGALADLDYRGITGRVSGSTVTLFAVRQAGAAGSPGELVSVVDSSGYNATVTATPTLLATGSANTALRGVALTPGVPLGPVMRITEFASTASNGEFIEFTNIGDAPADLSGWSFDDNSQIPDTQPLGLFGIVQPGESVILTESSASAFRTGWGLCAGVKVIGGLVANLGGGDEINLFDATDALVDRLTYTGAVTNTSRFASAAAVSATAIVNNFTLWGTSALGDAEASFASTIGTDLGSPGSSARAAFDYDPCIGVPGAPVVAIDQAATTDRIDLASNGSGAVSAVAADPSDPVATQGIVFTLSDPDGSVAALTVSVSSSNPTVVPNGGLDLQGTGATRTLRITPAGVGFALITLRAVDADGKIGTYIVDYAASAAAAAPAVTRHHTGSSDASTAQAVDADFMLVADDENQLLRLYSRSLSGLQGIGFDFTTALELPELNGGVPREVDIESSTRVGNRIYWAGSHGNQATGSFNPRPNRRRIFATDLSGSGALATLAYVDRYDFLVQDLVAWDNSNGHGLGAAALGLQASTAGNLSPEIPSGFNLEGLAIGTDGTTAYLAFRAPLLPPANQLPVTPSSTRTQALIIPVLQFPTLVVDGAAGSRPAGSATFGAPILVDLGGRSIRSIEGNVRGQFVISAGPVGPGSAVQQPRLFAWTGVPGAAPIELTVDLATLQADGAFESIIGLPETLGPAVELQLAVDNGDSLFYGDLVAAKDLAERRHAKFRSVRVVVDYPALPDALFGNGFEPLPAGRSP